MKRKVVEKKAAANIVEWVFANSRDAKNKYELTAATREQVQSLIDNLCKTHGIKQVGTLHYEH